MGGKGRAAHAHHAALEYGGERLLGVDGLQREGVFEAVIVPFVLEVVLDDDAGYHAAARDQMGRDLDDGAGDGGVHGSGDEAAHLADLLAAQHALADGHARAAGRADVLGHGDVHPLGRGERLDGQACAQAFAVADGVQRMDAARKGSDPVHTDKRPLSESVLRCTHVPTHSSFYFNTAFCKYQLFLR